MPAPSLDSLSTPANGQILALKKPLSKAAVQEAFKQAALRKTGRTVVEEVRQKRSSAAGDEWCSIICFPVTTVPSFFPESPLREQTYSFLLLVEVEVSGKWFLGVFRHGISSITDWLERKTKHLPRTKLASAFSDGTAVNRLSLQRMTVSKYELRGASYEASDLQTSLPIMAAGRCAIRSLRFSDSVYGSVSVTISTSRVQRSGGRCDVSDLAELVRTVAEETLAAKSNSFLATFAQAIPLDELPAGAVPNSILFDWSDLLDEGGLELFRAGTNDEVNKRLLTRVLGDTISVVADGAKWNFMKAPGSPLGSMAVTTTKYSVRSLLGGRLVVHDLQTDNTIPLAKWVRKTRPIA